MRRKKKKMRGLCDLDTRYLSRNVSSSNSRSSSSQSWKGSWLPIHETGLTCDGQVLVYQCQSLRWKFLAFASHRLKKKREGKRKPSQATYAVLCKFDLISPPSLTLKLSVPCSPPWLPWQVVISLCRRSGMEDGQARPLDTSI